MKLTKLIVVFSSLFIFQAVVFGQAEVERDKGIELYRAGQYAESVVVFEKLVADAQADHSTAMYLAANHIKLGNKKAAGKVLGKLKDYKLRLTPPVYETKMKIVRKPQLNLGDGARRMTGSGSIKVLVEFKSDGKIGFTFPFGGSAADAGTSTELNEGTMRAAKGITFEPAVINGKPVTVVNMLEYSFSIH